MLEKLRKSIQEWCAGNTITKNNCEKESVGHRRKAEVLNSVVAQRLYRFGSGKTSCADRSLITFVLAYMEEGNHYKLSDTIRLLTLQN